ncbi:radical SAM protein [Pseudodesulfovibrio cashew]|uniref:Radical SAM protein n=1 Tax=Pseudodesulfovibrio cashew TaxID=2678688 RepID=A0A6I6J973_9BACT|nr:radical SAM protein [Pseudodesulfovibrio cashew]QGY39376.1 radical SAM protein [Pseudodesulfovibrio cashew]
MGLLYTKMKIFHYKDKLDSLPRDREILPPLHIRIKPTNRCNHNCGYCAYRAENLQLGQDMDTSDAIPREKMAEIVEDVIDMGVGAVTFSGGGEPFVYPHLLETATALKAGGVKVASLTNGSRLSGELSEFFAHEGTWLRVSLDGYDDESYARYRGVKQGAFSELMENMTAFKRLGGPCYLGVSLIVDSENQAHVRDLLFRLRDTGVDSVKVSPCIVDNDGARNNEYHRPFFEAVSKQVAEAKAALDAEDFLIYDAYHELDEKFGKPYASCPYCQILPVIGADLNLYPCQDKAYNLEEGLLGTLKDKRFRELWFSDKNRFFKIDPSVHCNHHCVANAKNLLVHEYLGADPEHMEFV